MPYQPIIFLQGDDANKPIDLLYCREPADTTLTDLRTAFLRAHGIHGDPSVALRVLELEPDNEWLPSPYSEVYHGPTAESVAATFAYLLQWEYGEPTEDHDEPSSGTGDDAWTSDDGAYRLSAHLGLGYVGLERVTLIREPGYFTCPCCGDVSVGSGRDRVCSECIGSGCQPTTDASGETSYWSCDRDDMDYES